MEISPDAMTLADNLTPHVLAAVSEREDLTARPEEWHGTPGEWVQALNAIVKSLTPIVVQVAETNGAALVAGKKAPVKRKGK